MVELKNIVSFKYTLPDNCVTAYLPPTALVPLYAPGSALKPSIKTGDKVKEGQVIVFGDGKNCNVHAPIPGIIREFPQVCLPDGNHGIVAAIELAGAFSHLGKTKRKKKLETLLPEKIVSLINEKGVINTFKYSKPLASQIQQKGGTTRDFLVVRLYDLDPTCCTDTFMFNTFTQIVFEGAEILAKALGAATIVFLYDTKTFGIKNPEKDIQHSFFSFQPVFIPINTAYYPCGGSHEIVDLIKKSAKKEAQNVCPDDLMVDTLTLYSVYEAVILNLPVMNRFVYVAGDGVKKPQMVKVRIGTPLSALIAECGGLTECPGKIIINGLIRGNETSDLSSPVTKDLKSIHIMSKKQLQDRQRYSCVRCGRCRYVCPAKLQPDIIYARPAEHLLEAQRCYDCRLCNATCTSRLPLNQVIRSLALQHREKGDD